MISKRAFYLLITLLILAGAGIGDALYLTLSHGRELAFCNIIEGCNLVLASQYSEFFGIPTALYGVIYYVAVFLLTLMVLAKPVRFYQKLLTLVPWIGLLATCGFIYLQAFVIRAWCQFCLISAGISIFIFILSVFLKKEFSKTHEESPQ